jgi:hypothetical protein
MTAGVFIRYFVKLNGHIPYLNTADALAPLGVQDALYGRIPSRLE